MRSFMLRHRWKIFIGFGVFVALTVGYLKIIREPEPEIITAVAERRDLVQTVEAVGTVTSERSLALQFPASGVVAEVLVKEGDLVKAGQRLASLRSGDVQASVQSAQASLQAAQADLRALEEGSRPEDIAISEAEVANRHAVLQAAREKLASSEQKILVLKQEAAVSLSGETAKASSSASRRITDVQNALSVMDDVFDDADIQDAFIRSNPAALQELKNKIKKVEEQVTQLQRTPFNLSDSLQAREALRMSRDIISSASQVVDDFFRAVATVPPTNVFTTSEREARKSDLADERTSLKTALSDIDSSLKSLQDASASFDTKIAAEETTIAGLKGDILTQETALRTQEANLNLKRAGSRQTDIDASAARVRQAQADLNRSLAQLKDRILAAPVDGTITKVNIKTGELLSTAFQQLPAVTMLGDSPYRIEMYAAEIDITKVMLGLSGSVMLDAFHARAFPLSVSEIDPAATDVDGVPKYLVTLDFVLAPDGLKIGMTGDVDIVTGMRENVVTIPARAVIENEMNQSVVRVIGAGGEIEDRRVETGMEGISDIEVLSGIREGETVVVLLRK